MRPYPGNRVGEGPRPRRRVVVTGLGAITPVGLTAPESWEAFVTGRSGVGPVTRFDASSYPSRIAAEVKGFDPRRSMDGKEAKYMARCSQFAVAAAQEALQDAGLSWPLNDERAAVAFGTGVGGFELYKEGMNSSGEGNRLRVHPLTAINGLANMPAFHLSQRYGCQGPLHTVVTACAAGTQAVGEALELIRRGHADVVLTGGVEALIIDLFLASFCAMRILSTRNDEPERASRPFDAGRDGFVIGEGCAVLVLESLEHAQARGARIYAELLGQSASADAYHIAAPDPEADGAVRAMRWALADAGIEPTDVDYINAHGTATVLNDVVETRAIKQVFGEHAYRLAISSTKSMIGHCFGGAGAIEALVCVYSAYYDVIHPTINYETPDPECDLDVVPNVARRVQVNVAMSNSFGLGGQNACLVVGKYRG
ncbi:MAG: beta-ketoacyl-ACP synthase II [Anaerolineae bacterium]|nr:beta-ketoacyl-ACP synthase II [Anaerolineae bacterium]